MILKISAPSRSIEGDLSRHLLNLPSGREILSGLPSGPLALGKSLIEQKFRQAWDDLAPLLPTSDGETACIVEIEDDLGKTKPEMLGFFNTYRTRREKGYFFGISNHVVLAYLYEHLGLPFPQGMPEVSHSLWHHELIHLADYHNIIFFQMAIEQSMEDDRLSATGLSDYYGSPKARANQRNYLGLINHYRVEGIAMLYEIIRGLGTVPEIPSEDLGFFKMGLSSLTVDPDSSQESVHYENRREALHDYAYLAGPFLLLISLYPELKSETEKQLWHKAKHIVFDRSEEIFSLEESRALLQKAIELDLCTYLKNMATQNHPIDDVRYLVLSEVVDAVRESFRDGQESAPGMTVQEEFDALLAHAAAGNEAGFVETLKGVIGKPLDPAEIRRAFPPFWEKINQGTDRLHRLIAQKTEALYHTWQQDAEPDSLPAYLLSYVLESVDLIDDHLPLIGYLDDVFVLECAEALASTAGPK
jgi:uncharacterized membrane protein YkvA (DUF1232 family)